MNAINAFIGRLLYPEMAKFVDGLSAASVKAAQEMQGFDEEVKMLCYNWLGEGPYAFVSGIFLKSEAWNRPFIAALEKSGMCDPQGCLTLTQGYYLKFLKTLTIQASEYQKYSTTRIAAEVRSKMSHGNDILAATAEFEEAFRHLSSPDDFAMCYVEKILAIQYPDETERSSKYFGILGDSQAMFGLAAFTAESLKFAKQVDSQTGAK